jgi:hypothetical protein
MKTPEKKEYNFLSMTNALPRRFLRKLEKVLKREAKNWTPFEGVPESIPIRELGQRVSPMA